MSVVLQSTMPSPAPVGTVITWTASVNDPAPGDIWYRFRVRQLGPDFHTVRDFGPVTSLDILTREGNYDLEVMARNVATGDMAVKTVLFQSVSAVAGGQPVVLPTTNALVYLYSAPACPVGGRMRVEFRPAFTGPAIRPARARSVRDTSRSGGEELPQTTPWQDCLDGMNLNVLLGGMRAETEYTAQQVVQVGSNEVQGPVLSFRTGQIGAILPASALRVPPQRLLPQQTLLLGGFSVSVAMDVKGNVVWYHCCISMTRPAGGGTFFGIISSGSGGPSARLVREFDLLGLPVRETNAARINEQLAAMGMRQIDAFHHEARPLPGGKILVLASTEQVLTDVQGPGPVNVLGDMILVLDQELQVEWVWDSFAHLDVARRAVLDEDCGACPPLTGGTPEDTKDWLHGNAVERTADGNLLYSARHQDWLFKIDYRDGEGSGAVLWRLGKDGDFQLDASGTYPWFSHQHDAEFEADGTLTLFDNGNTRQELYPDAHSRGQAIQLDEAGRVAHLMLNADLRAYSLALGSAQQLSDGNYHFNSGWLQRVPNALPSFSYATEVDPSGEFVYRLEVSAPLYRSFRLNSLYDSDHPLP